ncbi:MAG: PHP domain-containing protein [Chloroflexi bacterium]|nr:PHP domain-containing protein [Chloroflexota bacterium]
MKIDTHAHTSQFSPCSLLPAPDLIIQTYEAGLDGLVITEHNCQWKGSQLDEIKSALRLPEKFLLAAGQEIDSDAGHILVYGCDCDFGVNRHWKDILKIVEESGGAAVLAHPFRWKCNVPGDGYDEFLRSFSAIEVRSANLPYAAQAEGIDTARRLKIPAAGGSDAHAHDMAATYFTFFPDDVRNINDLTAAIKAGRIRPGRLRHGGNNVKKRGHL